MILYKIKMYVLRILSDAFDEIFSFIDYKSHCERYDRQQNDKGKNGLWGGNDSDKFEA